MVAPFIAVGFEVHSNAEWPPRLTRRRILRPSRMIHALSYSSFLFNLPQPSALISNAECSQLVSQLFPGDSELQQLLHIFKVQQIELLLLYGG